MQRDDIVIKDRCYLVIDMKSFFASVECAERGLDPMRASLVVADKTRGEGTVCLAVSPALKKQGVKNRCRLYEIPKNIDMIVVQPRMKKYIEYASEIYAIYLNYIDKSDIHVYSIDECFLDISDYLRLYSTNVRSFAKKLTDEIFDKLHIPSSVGIGTNLYLAKIALDITAKNSVDRIGMLDEQKYIKTLWHHKPLSDFWQVSTGTINRLEKFGIYDMAGIANCDQEILYNEFGINAELLIDHAWGRESCQMSDIKNYKAKSRSISSSQILPRNYSFAEAKIILKGMIQDGCYTLSSRKLSTSNLGIYIGYGDGKRGSEKATIKLPITTNVYSLIIDFALKLYEKIADKKREIRKVAFAFGDIVSEEYEKYDLFAPNVKKQKNVVSGVIKIKEKYGKNSIIKGLDLDKSATQQERNILIGGHKSGETHKNAKQ